MTSLLYVNKTMRYDHLTKNHPPPFSTLDSAPLPFNYAYSRFTKSRGHTVTVLMHPEVACSIPCHCTRWLEVAHKWLQMAPRVQSGALQSHSSNRLWFLLYFSRGFCDIFAWFLFNFSYQWLRHLNVVFSESREENYGSVCPFRVDFKV